MWDICSHGCEGASLSASACIMAATGLPPNLVVCVSLLMRLMNNALMCLVRAVERLLIRLNTLFYS